MVTGALRRARSPELVGVSGTLLSCAHAGFTSPTLRLSAAISPGESFLTVDISPALGSAASAKYFVVAAMAFSGAAIATLKYSKDGALTRMAEGRHGASAALTSGSVGMATWTT